MSKIEYLPYDEVKASHAIQSIKNVKRELQKGCFMNKIEFLPYDEVKASHENAKCDLKKGYSVEYDFVDGGFGFNGLLPDDSVFKSRPCEDGTYWWFDIVSICQYFHYIVDKYGAVTVYDIKKALAPMAFDLKEAEIEDHSYGYTNTDFFVLRRVRSGLSFTVLEDPIYLL